MMPVVYTPGVGEACQQFSHIFRRSRGLYISYEQRHNIDTILRNHARPPAVIVVTDGERILGLGDQGVGGMGIPAGKLSLYTACAGIPPSLTLPILLDVGTDNRDRLNDPLYLGLRQQRIRGPEYQDFIDRFVDAVMRVYPDAVLQWGRLHEGQRAGLFTEAVVSAMAACNDRPIVFPLSNPTSKSECTAEQAIRRSDGRAIVATGSPSDPVIHGGRTHRVGQGNNAFVFPGVGLGLWAVYPELTRIRDCRHAVGCAVIRRAVAERHASPGILASPDETVRNAMWFPTSRDSANHRRRDQTP
jgi:malic enzyme